MSIEEVYIAIVMLLPILGALSALLVKNKDHSGWVASGLSLCIFISCVLLWLSWSSSIYKSFDWFQTGQFVFKIGFLLDKLALIMLLVVSLITFLVHVFSIEYMKEDEGRKRYFAFLGLFAFSMYGIILSSNLFLTFCFWELVGFSSYLLIGFWYQKDEPRRASFKAFIVNRVGDAGFLIGIFILFAFFKTFELPVLYELFAVEQPQLSSDLLFLLGIGLFFGAVGKSAQFPLQTWLPDAMAGPTPVSALIHAATMVAAGVFMLIRVFPMLSIEVLITISIVGAITAFMAAFAAFAQNDIKKVLAFSTISQLGYMMIAIGTGNPDAAFFHLTTHAFFKAGLFLCAGSIIHVLHKKYTSVDAQDMRKMGGLKSKMPFTFIAYTVSMLALCGLPFFSGYFSKEAILISSIYPVHKTEITFQFVVPVLAIATVFMTAAYMGRQYFLVFFGQFDHDTASSKWNEPKLMVVPILLLSILSTWFWYGINPFGAGGEWLTSDLLFYTQTNTHGHQWWISLLSISLALLGLTIAYLIYYRDKRILLNIIPISIKKLSVKHWYLDDMQQLLMVNPMLMISNFTTWFDRKIVDGFVNGFAILNVILSQISGWFDKNIVDGCVTLLTRFSLIFGNIFRSIQGGKVQYYFVWALVGILLIFIFVF